MLCLVQAPTKRWNALKHGPRDKPCSGSYLAPLCASTSHRPTLVATGQDPPSNDGKPKAPLSTAGVSDALTHPSWSSKINRIPRAARASCRSLLADILERIIESPNSKLAWKELLSFASIILAKPKHGGAKRNLSKIINKRTASWVKTV